MSICFKLADIIAPHTRSWEIIILKYWNVHFCLFMTEVACDFGFTI